MITGHNMKQLAKRSSASTILLTGRFEKLLALVCLLLTLAISIDFID